ncbi:hypothetical protein KSP40_PGU009530 [Platanthera guangdongensis]|uniref:Uncharacterized protein n=1 Tax=Platanthera guangdongensis TaxID=2320717 RepID=A0ABR2LNE0_9ASPA
METSLGQCKQTESEEYVMLDLESVCLPADILANTPYTLSVSFFPFKHFYFFTETLNENLKEVTTSNDN